MVRLGHAFEYDSGDTDSSPAYKDGKYIFPNDEVSI